MQRSEISARYFGCCGLCGPGVSKVLGFSSLGFPPRLPFPYAAAFSGLSRQRVQCRPSELGHGAGELLAFESRVASPVVENGFGPAAVRLGYRVLTFRVGIKVPKARACYSVPPYLDFRRRCDQKASRYPSQESVGST